jgi:tetratricopeptide (TPR) repeat protein
MTGQLLRCAFYLSAFTLPALAQGRLGSPFGETRGSTPTPLSTADSNSARSLAVTAFISGKVALDDGSELTERATIQTICRGHRHTEGFTDRHGHFSFQFADPTSASVGDAGDASGSMMTQSRATQERQYWRDCEVWAVLPGFSSDVVELARRMTTLESTDIGRISLHRLERVEGTSISVTSALAPNAAKKALEKAHEEERKGKWNQAQQSLEKAVQIYPKYAAAWSELGYLQMRKNDTVAAKNSFEQSLAADSKYVNPYDGLAQLAFQAKQWTNVVEITDKLLALNPVDFPSAYLYNGVANYYLGNLDAGERTIRQGIRVDDGHQVPKLRYVLGMILRQKRQYQEASEQFQQYLQLAKQPADIEQAKKELAEIARLSAVASPAVMSEKR